MTNDQLAIGNERGKDQCKMFNGQLAMGSEKINAKWSIIN
jgi:hypothetical protein